MNKNKKLYNQSLDPQNMVVNVYPLIIDDIGFDFQSITKCLKRQKKH